MDSVARWLEQLGLGQYASVFIENDVDEEVLSELTDSDLEKLGVTLGHRKKILKAVAVLRKNGFLAEAFDWDQSLGPSDLKIPPTVMDPGDMSPRQLQWLREQGKI